jgi:hypothetical protein
MDHAGRIGARDIRSVLVMHLEPLSHDRRPGMTIRHESDELRCDDPPGTLASD